MIGSKTLLFQANTRDFVHGKEPCAEHPLPRRSIRPFNQLALRAGLSGTSCVPNGAVIQTVVSGLQRVLLILFLQWPTVATQRDPSLLTVLKALPFLLDGLHCAQ